jgi:A/G-specific adenine glycosylase
MATRTAKPVSTPLPRSVRELRAIREAVEAWFREARRPLPWRERYDPYEVWIAEVMLQQTQVDTVIPYHRRWLERFPDVASVAAAPEEAVLKAWEGLGYYARARNLRRASQAIVTRHGGRLPERLEELLALPGVGRYTAGAIVSIGYNRPAPLVDGNVARVLGRLFALDVPARSTAGQARLWAWAEALVPPAPKEVPAASGAVKAGAAAASPAETGPRAFNQGLMELGALICRQRAPHCLLCPLSDPCRARQTGDPERFPPPAVRRARPWREGALLLLEREGRLLVRRRPSQGVWGGLWELPWAERGRGETARAAARRLLADLGCRGAGRLRLLGPLEHGLTHFTLALECFAARLDGPPGAEEGPAGAGEPSHPLRWVSRAELAALPLARLTHKALALADPDR